MSPVDSIRPPKRVKKTVPIPSAVAPVQSASTGKKSPIPNEIRKKPAASPDYTATSQKHKTIIMIVAVIMAVVFISWVALFMSGKLTRSSSSNFGSTISNKFKNLWENIKTDVLKIKNIGQNINAANVNEEQIKNLENSVFPQFNDPTKQ